MFWSCLYGWNHSQDQLTWNSKYHYVSLRPAISTEAHRLNAYGDSSGQLHIAPQDGDFSIDDHGGDILSEDETEEDDDDDLAELSEP